MKSLSTEERPIIGQAINEVKTFINNLIDEKNKNLKEKELSEKLESEVVDISFQVSKKNTTMELYILWMRLLNFIKKMFFVKMGFDVVDGPEIEKVEYNFDALNIPKSHPSRDITDTFYIDDSILLRTQTSPVQIRYMLEHKAPLRMICPGKFTDWLWHFSYSDVSSNGRISNWRKYFFCWFKRNFNTICKRSFWR